MRPIDDEQHKFLYELGEGSYGVVYLVEDKVNGGLLAIKIPKPCEHSPISALEESLREEISHLIKLSPYSNPHKNIVQPKGIKRFRSEEGSDLLGIITEFIPGRLTDLGRIKGCDLESFLAGHPRRIPLDIDVLIDSMKQVCSALSHAHKNKVFHRDIKPNNILVKLPEGTIKVVDWGVAKNIELDGFWEGSIVGTRPYMPPELLVLMDLYHPHDGKSLASPDHRADIYSLGITIFKIATGKHPFRSGQEIRDAEHRKLQHEILKDALTESISLVVMKSIEFDPENRYSTIDEFSAALTAAAAVRHSSNQNAQSSNSDIQTKLKFRLAEISGQIRSGSSGGSIEGRYRALLSEFPSCEEVYLAYAGFCSTYRSPEEAVRVLSEGIAALPEVPTFYFQRARISRELNRLSAAIQDMETALRLGLPPDKIRMAERLLKMMLESSCILT